MNFINIFLETLFKFINYVVFFILAIFCLKLIVKIYKLINNYLQNKKEINTYQELNININLINELSMEEFKLWCILALKETDCLNFVNKLSTPYLICTKNNENFLIHCCSDKNKIITEHTLQSTLGFMVSKDIYNCILVCNSTVSDSAKNFIKTLPFSYKLEILTCKDLMPKYSTKAMVLQKS
jgi:hypothetical protein